MKLNDKLIPRLFLAALFLLCFVPFASAQSANKDEYPKVEIFAGFSFLGEKGNHVISFGSNNLGANYAGSSGFETSLIRNFNKHIGIKGDFSAHFNNGSASGPISGCTPVCTTVTQNYQLKTRVYNFLAGPEFKARNSTRFTPFAHALGGLGHTSATFKTLGPTFILLFKRNDTGFAMALGGGLDIRASNKISIRGGMDYNPVFVHDPAIGSRRDFARFSLGVVFH